MGGPSEREYKEKLDKIKEKLSKKAKDIKNQFEKIEKAKVDLLKKTKEMKHDTEREILKMEEEITKSKDLAPESKTRLHLEIDTLKTEARRQYSELETRIAETITQQ
ncbi:hypothetical protein KEJ45_04605 [Candidatus Bathyarchaeota archaeon]|nr:hypothetical protein [Candidatus Bathyarchaeota archaeon]